jgi:DNA-binding NarL/FixJ family response regulator
MHLDSTNIEILKLLSQDKTVKEIPPLVFRSYDTVKKRLKCMKSHAKVSTNAALLMYFYNQFNQLQEAV